MDHIKDVLFKDLFAAFQAREELNDKISNLQIEKRTCEDHITKELLAHNMHFCLSVNWSNLRRFLYSK
jgi:cell division protein FtsL